MLLKLKNILNCLIQVAVVKIFRDTDIPNNTAIDVYDSAEADRRFNVACKGWNDL